LLAAGEWQQAIDVIGGSIHADHSEGRARVMLPAISAMYSAPSKEIAYNYLAQGLRYAYPFVSVCLYDYDLKRGFLIQQVHRDTDWPHKINALGHHFVARALHLKDDDHKAVGTQLLIPLGERDRRVGVVLLSKFFDSQMEHRRHEQVQEVVGYLRHAAQALHYRKEIERLRDQEKQYTRRLETVLKAARALMTSSKSFDEVLDQVLNLIQKAFGAKKVQGGSVFLYDRDTGELCMRAQLGYHVTQRRISLKPGWGFAGHVYKRGISVIESDRRTHASTFVDLQGITPDVISAVGTPIFDRQRHCMGVICLDNFDNPGMFSESDKAVLEIFAWQIAPWLENVRLLEALHNLQKIISELRDLWAKRFYVFAENLAERLVKTFEISGCAIGLRVDKQIIFFGVQKGLRLSEKQRESDLPHVLRNKVLRRGNLALIDPTQNGWQHLFGDSAFASLVAIPLKGRKQNHGLILLVSRGKFQPSPAESQALLSFAGQLALVLEQARSINYRLTYKPSSLENINRCVDFIRWDKESERPTPEALRSQVTELLRLLFPDARSLWVEQRYQGLSGSVVLRVLPTFKVGPGQNWIVKIGRNDKASREEEHYETFVKNFLPYTHAVKIASHYSRDIGALQYSLANSGSGQTQTFEEFYATESAEAILSGLQRLFNETCKLWYDKAKPAVGNMRNWYEKALELKKNELADYFVQMRSEDDLRLPTLAFVGRESRLLNPLRWLNGSPKTMRARVGITHGDLNATNILVSETGEFWLIDFLRTGESHILRDFAVLETDLKYRIARHITLAEFYSLEEFLLDRELAADFESNPEVPKNLKKLASVLLGLRALAHKQLQGAARDMQREFLTSLSIVTLNVIRLRHFRADPDLQPQRERALFSAALMVEAIKRLEA
jgi:GAF domain-containing protein/thiamine kinase-like enzyme